MTWSNASEDVKVRTSMHVNEKTNILKIILHYPMTIKCLYLGA